MSDNQNEKALRIAAYIQNKLSPEQREAFKRALSEDDDLRVQYVDALMNRAGTPVEQVEGEAVVEQGAGEAVVEERAGEAVVEQGAGETAVEQGAGEAVVEPVEKEAVVEWVERETVIEQGAGEVLEAPDVHGETEAPEAGWVGGKKRAKGRFFGSGWMVAAVLLLLLIAGVVIFLWARHQAFWDNTVAAITADSGEANKGNKIDSMAGAAGNRQVAATGSGVDSTKSGARTAVASTKGGWADSVYTKLYKPYMRGNDPAAVREYYQEYRTGNYAAVLAADDSVVVKGTSMQKVQLRDYMRLYKGLAYLATGDGEGAVTQLGAVVYRTNPGNDLYEAARWYLALAWLRRSDVDPAEARGKALVLARDISRGYSRYRAPALELLRYFSK
jgi:hypothetical protein